MITFAAASLIEAAADAAGTGGATSATVAIELATARLRAEAVHTGQPYNGGSLARAAHHARRGYDAYVKAVPAALSAPLAAQLAGLLAWLAGTDRIN